MRAQHKSYDGSLERRAVDMQKRFWEDLAKIREDFERIIHRELRTIRQRPAMGPSRLAASPERRVRLFRSIGYGVCESRSEVQKIGSARSRAVCGAVAGTVGEILDIGCGRGEFLAAASEAGLNARGIELSQECVEVCRGKGLAAECEDLFAYLESRADGSVAGLYCCSQVVEHLSPAAVARFCGSCGTQVAERALVAFETPNPECLAMFATHFYIDPTHTRPVPASLLAFCLEEAGFGSIEVEYLEPAVDSLPELAELPSGLEIGSSVGWTTRFLAGRIL